MAQNITNTFPLELLLIVIDFLERKDHFSLRLSCKPFLDLATPLIFRQLKLSISDSDTARLVKILSSSHESISAHYQSLFITSSRSRHRHQQASEPQDTHLKDYRWKLLSLEDEEYHGNFGNPGNQTIRKSVKERGYLTVQHPFARLPSLRHVRIWLEGCKIGDCTALPYPALRGFKSLSSFSLELSPRSCEHFPVQYCKKQLVPFLGANPRLQSLELGNYRTVQVQRTLSSGNMKRTCLPPHELLKDSPVRLQALKIHQIPLPSLEFLALHHLTKLTIRCSMYRSGSAGVAYKDLWDVLGQAGVRLLELSVSGMEDTMDEMMEYLRSYVGLRLFRMTGLRKDQQKEESRLATIFWQIIKENHSCTLEELVVRTYIPGDFCYGPAASAALKICGNLDRLMICPTKLDNDWVKEKVRTAAESPGTLVELKSLLPDLEECTVLALADLQKQLKYFAIPPISDPRIKHRVSRGLSKSTARVLRPLATYIHGLRDSPRSMHVQNEKSFRWPLFMKISLPVWTMQCFVLTNDGNKWRYDTDSCSDECDGDELDFFAWLSEAMGED